MGPEERTSGLRRVFFFPIYLFLVCDDLIICVKYGGMDGGCLFSQFYKLVYMYNYIRFRFGFAMDQSNDRGLL